MKKKLTLLLAAASTFSVNSQVVLSENFDAPFTLNATSGWTVQNNSTPTSSLSWFQGNSTVFGSYNGSPGSYYGVNYNSTTGTGDVSNWLISPSVTIYNGAIFEFATRTTNSGTATPIPDRLQLRMSQSNPYTLPVGATSIGSFTDLLLDINPNLTSNNASAVNNGSVNGYPQAWTVYSVAITNVTGTVTGRFALRYFVTNGGPSGANSDYIGVDAVNYLLPCGHTVPNFTICPNVTTTLNAVGGNAITTYSWHNGATTPSIVVNPSVTSTYTLFPLNGTVSCANPVTATVTVGSQLSMQINASSNTICAGSNVTLSALSSASSYSWSTGSTSSTIIVTPSITSTYSVGGSNNSCFGGNTININVLPLPSLSVSSSPSVGCPGSTISITASGANDYLWVLDTQTSTLNPVTVNTKYK